MNKYECMLANLHYVNKGMTGRNAQIKETLSGGLAYDFDIQPVIEGLVKFFRTCFKKTIYFEAEISGYTIGKSADRLYFFQFNYDDMEGETIHVYKCDKYGHFNSLEDGQIISQKKFITNFKAFAAEMIEAANN